MLELHPSLAASDPALSAMLAFLSTNADIRRLRAGLGAGIDLVQPDVSTSPRGVLCQVSSGLQYVAYLCSGRQASPW